MFHLHFTSFYNLYKLYREKIEIILYHQTNTLVIEGKRVSGWRKVARLLIQRVTPTLFLWVTSINSTTHNEYPIVSSGTIGYSIFFIIYILWTG